ncbi:large conductance mechanosensitive channel protein MscL [Rhodocaloribacter sp.]
MLKEFKEFAMKGNMVDMAVGIIIGAAFGAVVKSMVDDILMPIIAAVFGTPDFSNLFIILRNPSEVAGMDLETVAAVREAGGVALAYGTFLNVFIAFLIVAFVLFLVVKAMNRMKRKEEAAPAPPPKPSAEEKLLAEIRDLLKSQAS